ncbi:hypothetical protein ACE0DR_07980 [Azotobacter sp. CWF10]
MTVQVPTLSDGIESCNRVFPGGDGADEVFAVLLSESAGIFVSIDRSASEGEFA